MKVLSDWSINDLELKLRDLHGTRSTKGMQLEKRIREELERRRKEAEK